MEVKIVIRILRIIMEIVVSEDVEIIQKGLKLFIM
jgi:hypothetical protein